MLWVSGCRRPMPDDVVRSTVDLPRGVNKGLRRFAVDHDTTLQAILGALAAAVTESDRRVLDVLSERIDGLRLPD